jgi:hypothetical protein
MLKKDQSLIDYFGRCPTDDQVKTLIYDLAGEVERLESEVSKLKEAKKVQIRSIHELWGGLNKIEDVIENLR